MKSFNSSIYLLKRTELKEGILSESVLSDSNILRDRMLVFLLENIYFLVFENRFLSLYKLKNIYHENKDYFFKHYTMLALILFSFSVHGQNAPLYKLDSIVNSNGIKKMTFAYEEGRVIEKLDYTQSMDFAFPDGIRKTRYEYDNHGRILLEDGYDWGGKIGYML